MTKMTQGAAAPYKAPKLAIYGGFSKLTAAGSMQFTEGANQGPNAKATRMVV